MSISIKETTQDIIEYVEYLKNELDVETATISFNLKEVDISFIKDGTVYMKKFDTGRNNYHITQLDYKQAILLAYEYGLGIRLDTWTNDKVVVVDRDETLDEEHISLTMISEDGVSVWFPSKEEKDSEKWSIVKVTV